METDRKPKELTPQQFTMIQTYQRMGQSLSENLASAPAVTSKLSSLLHDTPLGYEGVIKNFLLESDRNPLEIADDPFIKAFEVTKLCTDDEADLLTRFREAAQTGSIGPELAAEFQDWVENRAPIMAKGFQRFVLDAGIIPPFKPEEISNKSAEALKARREAEPERFAEIQRQATQAAAEQAGPKVFTDKVRSKIQSWFDKGFEYDTVIELLRGVGVITTKGSLVQGVCDYPDLHYTPEEIKEQRREGFLRSLKVIFEMTGSSKQTQEILADLGFSPAVTRKYLNRLGLRHKINWDAVVEAGEQEVKLRELALPFISDPSIKAGHQAFVEHLRQEGVNIDISYKSFEGLRRKLRV